MDVPALRYVCRINGLTHVNITKLDVLDKLPEIKVGKTVCAWWCWERWIALAGTWSGQGEAVVSSGVSNGRRRPHTTPAGPFKSVAAKGS
jgi:hypothetical protein